MKKSKLEDRKEYVKSVVNDADNTTQAVKQLADELYLSEQTIWKDLV